MRLEVFKAKTAAQKNLKDSGEWDRLSPEQQRLVEKMVSCVMEAALAGGS
jgi:metallopeptidase MepB